MEILYFPPLTIPEILPWLRNFVNFLKATYSDYGITDEEMTRLDTLLAALEYAFGRNEASAEAANGFLADRNAIWWGDPKRPELKLVQWTPQVANVQENQVPAEVAPNGYDFVKNIVQRLRNYPNMTESLSRQLAILVRQKSKGMSESYVPILVGSIQNGKAVLDCPVKGFAGYLVMRDRTNTNNFTKVDKSVGRTWLDDEPLPDGINAELRLYKVQMLDTNNNPVGEFSNTVGLTVSRVV